MTLFERVQRHGNLNKQKKCVVEKVVLEQINDGGESVANLFISLKKWECDEQFNNF